MDIQVVGMQKLSDFAELPSVSASAPYEPPGETFTA